jgi:hypothetical protein
LKNTWLLLILLIINYLILFYFSFKILEIFAMLLLHSCHMDLSQMGRWTAITQLTHHGMLFVPIGYTFGADMFSLEQPRGGSPYGAGTFAGDGTKTPTDIELALAEHQGRYTADIVKKLASNN